jgi:hypothetical protein
MYEVALWEDIWTIDGQKAYYAYQVNNQAIVVKENVDAIRALRGESAPRKRRLSGRINLSHPATLRLKCERTLHECR